MTEVAASAAGRARNEGRLARVWRGGYGPKASLWWGFVLPWLVATVALDAIASWMQVSGDGLSGGSTVLLLGWPLSFLLLLWGAVGACRAAFAGSAGPGRTNKAWGWFVLTVVAACLLSTAWGLLLNFGVQARSYVALAWGADPLGQVVATASPDGRRLRLKGHLGKDDAERVLTRLRELPELHLLELDMAGGRVAQARRVATAVLDRGLQTRVVGACNNVCVLVYLAGAGKQLAPQGRLGFHRLAPVSVNPLFAALVRREHAALYRATGLPEVFITKLNATPPGSLWQPETDELWSAGLVGVAGRPLDVASPGPAGTPAAEYVEALQTHSIWRALDARYVGTVAAAAERMAAARDAGADNETTQTAGQHVVEVLLPRLVADAGPGLWEPFAELLAEQLSAMRAQAPGGCAAVMAGDTKARRSMPAPLQLREAQWLAAALAEPVPEGPPRRPNALEREVMDRSLGEGVAALLTGLLGPRSRQSSCAQAMALLAAVNALPPAERRLARRFMFAPR